MLESTSWILDKMEPNILLKFAKIEKKMKIELLLEDRIFFLERSG